MTASLDVPDVKVRPFAELGELSQCESLYRRVFGLRPEDGSLNARLLVALDRNSGIVLGAFAGPELIGFAFSFLAQDDDGALYQYSQTAAVLPDWQGRGIGRQLKLAQRDVALARDIRRMRWAFDPFKVRNAHFNLDVLGARATELARDLYGQHGYGLDAGNSGDRLIADWRLASQRVERLANGHRTPVAATLSGVAANGTVWRQEGVATLFVPATWPTGTEYQTTVRLRGRILDAIGSLMSEGLVVVSCRRLTDDSAAYQFLASEDLAGDDLANDDFPSQWLSRP